MENSEIPPAPPRFPSPTYHSLEDVPKDARIRQIYPEDIYPGGTLFPILRLTEDAKEIPQAHTSIYHMEEPGIGLLAQKTEGR